MKQLCKDFFFAFFCALGVLLVICTILFRKLFGDVSAEQIWFHLQFPLAHSDPAVIWRFIKCVIIAFIIFIIAFIYPRIFKNIATKIAKYRFILPILLLCAGGIYVQSTIHAFELLTYKKNKNYGEFYENYYVNPDSVPIIPPKEKRNLVLIFAESMESTFASYQIGGGYNDAHDSTNLIPNLTTLAQNHINFSDNAKLGGITELDGTSWTIAGIISHMCGIPLVVPMGGNAFNNYRFLDSATCLSDILQANGYINHFVMGSDESFAGRDNFLKTHNINNHDINYYKAKNRIPQNYFVHWGFEDSKLFGFAKEELLELSKQDKPFAMMLLTTNTHSPDGYVDKNTCDLKDKTYQNAILCSDREIGEFIAWAQEQSFYKDTTIIILGDHLSMKQGFFPQDSHRRIFNVFINTAIESNSTESSKNREMSHFDMFPTILSTLGFDITGDKLGLGVNLFSKESTLLEMLGSEKFNSGLNEDSKVYAEFWRVKR